MHSELPLSATDLIIGYKSKSKTSIAGPLNFQFSNGTLIGLIGVNGIGKSTLIKTLSGLLPPIEGSVDINDQSIYNLTPQDRAKQISLVLTDKINGGLATVEEIVKMGRYPYTNWQFALSNEDLKIIQSAIISVGLGGKQKELFSQLSDGNKQKVMIAKALAQDTPILILDEPTVHLDIKNRFIILELLQSLTKNHKKTILFSGHDLDYMISVCDSFMLMTPDRLEIDSPNSLLKSGAISKAFDVDITKIHNFNLTE